MTYPRQYRWEGQGAGIQTQAGLTRKTEVSFPLAHTGQRTSHISTLVLLPGPPPSPPMGTAGQRASTAAASSSNPLRSGDLKSL